MGIKLKTEEGFEFSFDTVEELMEFTQRMNAVTESTSDDGPAEDENEVPETDPKFEVGDEVRVVENKSGGHNVGTTGEIRAVNYVGPENRWSYVVSPISGNLSNNRQHHKESDLELSGSDNEIEVGDKVRIVSSDDGTELPYHYLDVGSVGTVVSIQLYGRIEVEVEGKTQYLLQHHYVKVEPLGQDANGEDLYKGDLVTGTEDNDYGYTNSRVDMEVLGEGSSLIDEEANIMVRILGKSGTYRVDSSKFIKLTDNPDEEEHEQEFKVGDLVRVIGNSNGHRAEIGEVLEIKEVDSIEPKYNLSKVRNGYWASTSDIEHVHSSQKLRTGDIVRVMEAFEDTFGDRVSLGAYYSYDENLGLGEPFVGTVFLGDNRDKIELVCRAGNRLDK